MKKAFSPKLARDGLRRNRRLFSPYLFTCIGTVAMFYIFAFLHESEAVANMRGGGNVRVIMGMGMCVLAVFSAIFLFYTHSFLLRSRKKEFGLYNILGLDKKNIAAVLFFENLYCALISLGAGLLFGIAFSKLAELGLLALIRSDVTYTLSVSSAAIGNTVGVFGVLFLLLFFSSLFQIQRTSAICLLHSESIGEKPPKANPLLGLAGVLMLGAAYFIAVTIQEPIKALGMFFIAVLLVIFGTYLLMIAGSVVFCRLLQKNRRYYYHRRHFVSVSSMVYRMKRNGAGLASICILATMVLVMISSTFSLYIGAEDAINARYPRDFTVRIRCEKDNLSTVREAMDAVLNEHHASLQNIVAYSRLKQQGVLSPDGTFSSALNQESIVGELYLVSLDDYNRSVGADETLADGEALIYGIHHAGIEKLKTVSLNGAVSLKIKRVVSRQIPDGDAVSMIYPITVLVVPDLDRLEDTLKNADPNGSLDRQFFFMFDTPLDSRRQLALWEALDDGLDTAAKNGKLTTSSVQCVAADRVDFYGTFGGLFYLGILLSIVFLFATVLIMYYKQLSEGTEDRVRFDIMQKIGMTKGDIRRSINSQMLTVFFLPLILAGVHLAFAFPMIQKLLTLFNLYNTALFAASTVTSFLMFALFYAIVYRMSSNAYYSIVSGTGKE